MTVKVRALVLDIDLLTHVPSEADRAAAEAERASAARNSLANNPLREHGRARDATNAAQMLKTELREALRARGLSATGKPWQLRERLQASTVLITTPVPVFGVALLLGRRCKRCVCDSCCRPSSTARKPRRRRRAAPRTTTTTRRP